MTAKGYGKSHFATRLNEILDSNRRPRRQRAPVLAVAVDDEPKLDPRFWKKDEKSGKFVLDFSETRE